MCSEKAFESLPALVLLMALLVPSSASLLLATVR
jgi:hypothetical protein